MFKNKKITKSVKYLFYTTAILGAFLTGTSSNITTASADTIATKVDSKTARTNPGDVWEGTITFKGKDNIQKGSWEMVLENPFADGVDGYRYTVGHGTWDTTNGKEYVQPIGFKTLEDDYRGYLLTIIVRDENGKKVDSNSTGVDVSSDWTKFPRYAALTQFEKTDDANKGPETLNKFHVNAMMYYDAYYRPQNPFPSEDFQDWLGNNLSLTTIKNNIKANHQRNQGALLYNMVNATTGTIEDEDAKLQDPAFKTITRKDGTKGIESNWGIFSTQERNTGDKAKTKDTPGEQLTHNMLGGWEAGRSDSSHKIQYYYNPWSHGWTNWIGDKMWGALNYLNFDGWQGDSIGNFSVTSYEDRYNQDKKDAKFDFNNGFGDMVNRLKGNQMRNYKMGVNAVGGKGQKNLDNSKADFQYAEIWSNWWDSDDNVAEGNKRKGEDYKHNTYYDLGRIVDNTRQNANQSLIMPAYMYRDWNKDKSPLPKEFNDNAILLKDATVFASGGDVMELADDANQIYNEYYTGVTNDKNIKMSNKLGNPDNGKLRKIYDFVTAYQNVLRGDSIQNNYHRVEITNSEGRQLADRYGGAHSIYTITKSGHDGYHDIETLNMINLTDVSNVNWQVSTKEDEASKVVNNTGKLHVKYYVDPFRRIDKVWMASPDKNDGRAKTLDFKRSWDKNGDYVEFDIDNLEYWNLIYMKG